MPNLPPRRRRDAAGFTLIELLLVLLIIGVLAGLVVPRFARRSEDARVSAARVDIDSNIPTALDLFELDAGQFPTTEQGLEALLTKPTSSPLPRKWNGPYVRGGLPSDPWDHSYVYVSPPRRGGTDYDLSSMGPDGVPGGGDDLTNWHDMP